MEELKGDALAVWVNDQIKEAKQAITDWRRCTIENYDFHAGRQWSEEDKSTMGETGRIPIVFNRIARTINAVSGLELQNRQEVRYIPRELGDAPVNEVFTNAAKWVRDNCNAEDEESEAFQDALKCGMGWTETYMDYETDSEGMIKIDRIDPLDMFWSHPAEKRNLEDARWMARKKKLSMDEFKELWPGVQPVYESLDPQEEGEPHDAQQAKYYLNDQGKDIKRKNIPVIQIQWWEREQYYQVVSENGNIIEFAPEKYKKIKDYITQKGLKALKRSRRKYKQAFVNGMTTLEEGDSPCKHNFSFKCITGLRDRNKNQWFGIIDLMKDPQRYANKWLSQIMYILSTNAKGGLLAEEGAFKNPRKAEEDWAKPDSIVWMNNGGLNRVKEKGQGEYPQGLDRLMNYAIESINDVPGINLEMLGLANRDQAGIVENQRKQSGLTILSIFFDSLRRYRKEQGRILAYFIQEYISDGRLIRVLGKETAQYVPLTKDQQTMEYDVIVDDSPSSPNVKEKTFATLSQLMPSLLQAGIPIPPDLLDFTPLPESLIQKWKAMLPDPNAPKPPDPEVVKAQTEMQMEQQKMQNQIQMQQQKMQMDMQMEQQKLQMEQQNNQARMQMEHEHQMHKLALEKAVAEQKLQLEIEKAQVDAQIKQSISDHEIKMSSQKQSAQIGMDSESHDADIAIKLGSDSESAEHPDNNDDKVNHNEIMSAIAQIIQKMDEPKVFKRDKSGKAVSMNGRPITRDQNGNIVALQ